MATTTMESLLIEDNRLKVQEKWLEDMIAKIKHQKMSLEVEQMQLNSMIRELEKQQNEDSSSKVGSNPRPDTNKETPVEEQRVNVELLDQAKSSVNTTTLDLTVLNDFNDMLQNPFYEETDDSENDEII